MSPYELLFGQEPVSAANGLKLEFLNNVLLILNLLVNGLLLLESNAPSSSISTTVYVLSQNPLLK
ncbi:hypothetical protein HDU99_009020, partial [Rhizoclosmatium hyalinum]